MGKINIIIKAKREQRGWDKSQMADRVGLSVSEYSDVEWHEDELVTVTPLMNVRRLAEAIDVSIHELFGIADLSSKKEDMYRHERVVEARKRIGFTQIQFAQGIGFSESFVDLLEVHPNLLEIYPYAVLEIVANYLMIPPQRLL